MFFATICKSICISKCTSFKHVVFKYPIHSVFYVKSLYLTLKTYYFSVFFWQNFQTFLPGRKTAVDDYNFNSVTYHIKIMQYHAKLNQCCAYYLEVIEPQVLFATKSSSPFCKWYIMKSWLKRFQVIRIWNYFQNSEPLSTPISFCL